MTPNINRSAVKILLVEDLSSMRRILESQLATLGFTRIVHAANGKEALNKLVTDTFSIIISDWHMPDMSGFELLQYVRGNVLHQKTPFIILTSETQHKNVLLAARSGVTSYLIKPFTTELLEKKVTLALS